MKSGFDFVKQLDIQVPQCDVLLAIIGTNWLDAHDDKCQRRLDSAHDYVRIELAAALTRDIPVIPVLVDGAMMPSEDTLPGRSQIARAPACIEAFVAWRVLWPPDNGLRGLGVGSPAPIIQPEKNP